jgi:electron transport complex protein RnfG
MRLPKISGSIMSRSVLQNSLVLGLFAVITVGLVAITQQATASRILAAERAAKSQTLSQLLPAGSFDNHLQDNQTLLAADPLLGTRSAQAAYLATLKGAPSAVILQVSAAEGYSGAIQLLVAISAQGRVIGVRVLKHKETPGLGDKIELGKSAWIRSFDGKSLTDPDAAGWAVKKDLGQFDQFAGATITPRAVVKAVHQALQYFAAHQRELLTTNAMEKPND